MEYFLVFDILLRIYAKLGVKINLLFLAELTEH